MDQVAIYRGYKIVPMSTYSDSVIVRRSESKEYVISEDISSAFEYIDEMTDGLFLN